MSRQQCGFGEVALVTALRADGPGEKVGGSQAGGSSGSDRGAAGEGWGVSAPWFACPHSLSLCTPAWQEAVETCWGRQTPEAPGARAGRGARPPGFRARPPSLVG